MELPMPKKLKSKKFAAIRAMILDLEDLIDGQKWLLDHQAAEEWRSHPWNAAETVICEVLPADPHPGKTYVASPYAVELSWLLDNLKIICSEFVFYGNKIAFYGRLADAANRYLGQRSPVQQNAKDLCFAVVREAMRMVEEAYLGELSGVRDEVRIKQTWVNLHPGASDEGAGMAVYRSPEGQGSPLANERFTFKGGTYRMGETHDLTPEDDHFLHIADYHEVHEGLGEGNTG
jgi:hypothetical protein